jgi:type II secretory pathway pseudopilin PulG
MLAAAAAAAPALQMNRTIQNYQKAYRKKVEGLKQELSTVRADNAHLRSQVRRLRRTRLLHAPSLVAGAAVGFLVTKLVQRLQQQPQGRQEKAAEQQQQEEQQAADKEEKQ